MSHCKDVVQSLRIKHVDAQLSIYISGAGVGGWDADPFNDWTSHPYPLGSWPLLRGRSQKWAGGKQLGQYVGLSSHPPSPTTQQEGPPLAPSADPHSQGCPILMQNRSLLEREQPQSNTAWQQECRPCVGLPGFQSQLYPFLAG